MPLYEYRCTACRHAFESLVNRWDSPAPACPQCGAAQAQRQLSVFAVASASPREQLPCGETGSCGAGGCACRAAAN